MARFVGVTADLINLALGDSVGTRYFPLAGGTLSAGAAIVWSGRSQITSPVDGVFLLRNNAGTGFTKIQMGGTTSGFVAIEGSSADLKVGLADASSWARIQAGQYEVRADAAYTAGGSGSMYVGFGSSTVRLFPGSGAPTLSIARGSLYLRTDGVPYYNVAGSTTYAPLTATTTNTQTGATYSVVDSDTNIIANRAGTVTLTLPDPAVYTNRELWVRTIQAQTVVSAGSNVVPLIGGAAGTAILAATAGKWAKLVSDATSWQIMAGN